MWATTLHEHGFAALQWGAVLGAALVAALWDARTRRIPNLLTGPLLLGGLVHAGVAGGWAGMADSSVACALLAAPYVVLFACADGGAGDAKLMGAIGSWLGLVDGTAALLCVCVAGVVMGVGWAFVHGHLRPVAARLGDFSRGLLHLPFRGVSARAVAASMPDRREGLRMPYGPAILAGCALALGASLSWNS
jgi:prepilin peptidase CpaA